MLSLISTLSLLTRGAITPIERTYYASQRKAAMMIYIAKKNKERGGKRRNENIQTYQRRNADV